MSLIVTPGLVVLVCASGHNHQMSPEQARRLKAEACYWCGEPMAGIYLSKAWRMERDQLIAEFCGDKAA